MRLLSREEVSQRIRSARKALGKTQAQLGAAVGLGQPVICSMESGLREISRHDLAKLAPALGLDLRDLLFDAPDDAPDDAEVIRCVSRLRVAVRALESELADLGPLLSVGAADEDREAVDEVPPATSTPDAPPVEG